VFRVSGVNTRLVDAEAEVPLLEIPEGMRRIVTRNAGSVVPVQLLD